ncbi:hypothetical protein OGAPHI_000308 [Ogataea philodendri]|uniref:Uncharacterized protein n=1 Tax=Ogataea philodendri TaxID=1378263 RepID=A0A9P8PHG7_9ASCO|nr:uncharacterized protein OGAPHI_000308 [Ogataea philodendri]KAH3671605.1 hypothetical protein OGAPHI_000308 [Ogataea philodendri]
MVWGQADIVDEMRVLHTFDPCKLRFSFYTAFKKRLSSSIWSQTAKEVQSVSLGLRNSVSTLNLEGDGASLWEVEGVTRGDVVGSSSLIADGELSVDLDVDLHLVIVVRVNQCLSSLLSVETARDLLIGWGIRGEGVRQECVVSWSRNGSWLDGVTVLGVGLVEKRHDTLR